MSRSTPQGCDSHDVGVSGRRCRSAVPRRWPTVRVGDAMIADGFAACHATRLLFAAFASCRPMRGCP